MGLTHTPVTHQTIGEIQSHCVQFYIDYIINKNKKSTDFEIHKSIKNVALSVTDYIQINIDGNFLSLPKIIHSESEDSTNLFNPYLLTFDNDFDIDEFQLSFQLFVYLRLGIMYERLYLYFA